MIGVGIWRPALLEPLRLRLGREAGQTGIEYAMVAVIIVAAVGAAFMIAGPTLRSLITGTINLISGLVSNAISAAGA